MPLYRNIGSESHIGRHKLDKLGQSVELTEDIARDALLGGAAILPDADYALFFNGEDEKKFGTVGAQKAAPSEFHDRHKEARVRVHELREGLKNGTTEAIELFRNHEEVNHG